MGQPNNQIVTNTTVIVNGLVGQTGSAASLTTVDGNGWVTVTGLTGMTSSSVGNIMYVTGAAAYFNNGAFTITAFIDATSVKLGDSLNPFTENDSNNGGIEWEEAATYTLVGDDGWQYLPALSGLGFQTTTGVDLTFHQGNIQFGASTTIPPTPLVYPNGPLIGGPQNKLRVTVRNGDCQFSITRSPILAGVDFKQSSMSGPDGRYLWTTIVPTCPPNVIRQLYMGSSLSLLGIGYNLFMYNADTSAHDVQVRVAGGAGNPVKYHKTVSIDPADLQLIDIIELHPGERIEARVNEATDYDDSVHIIAYWLDRRV